MKPSSFEWAVMKCAHFKYPNTLSWLNQNVVMSSAVFLFQHCLFHLLNTILSVGQVNILEREIFYIRPIVLKKEKIRKEKNIIYAKADNLQSVFGSPGWIFCRVTLKEPSKKLVTRDEGGCYLPQKPSLHAQSEEKKLMFFPEHQGSQSDSAECLSGTHSKDAAPTQQV